MIKKEITKKKSFQMNLALVAIGVLLVLGCPASSNSTGGPDDGSDTTAPTLSSSVPAADATDFAANSNIILTYSEPVLAGTGNITITPSAGAAITIAVTDAQVSIAGAMVTIDPTNDLAMSTTYTLTIPAGAFMDAAGNKTAEATLSFSTAAALDTTAPSFDSSSSVPAADATDFPANSNIVLTYSEAVQAGAGNITIVPSSGGATITIAVGDAQVSIAGAVVTINPTENLGLNTQYTLTVPAGAIVDASGNAGSMVTLSFSTAAVIDETAPTVISSVPAADATDINASLNIILTYNEPVQAGTGNITITPSGGNAITIAVGDAQVSFSGAVVTINPTNSLAVSTTYTLTVADGAIVDASGNAGSEVTLSFSTATNIVPVVISSVPVAGATDFPTTSSITLTFSAAVQKGTGEIVIRRRRDGATPTIPVGHSNVSISGAVVTITQTTQILLENNEYTLTIPAGVFESSADQTPAPEFILRFTTPDTIVPTLSSSVPASGATAAIADRDITLTYSEAVQAGSGNITLTPMSGTPLTIPVSSAQVSISGAVVTIDPMDVLELNTQYTLTIPAGAFTDATGNQTPELTLSFTTEASLTPRIVSHVPAEAGTIASDAGITLTYNQPMVKGSGMITLKTSNERMDTIDVSGSLVSTSGNVVTINISGFSSGRDSSDDSPYEVALTVPVAAFANADGKNPLSELILSFTVSRPAGE